MKFLWDMDIGMSYTQNKTVNIKNNHTVSMETDSNIFSNFLHILMSLFNGSSRKFQGDTSVAISYSPKYIVANVLP